MSIKKKRIAILGSTGSIGTQALDVIKSHPELFEVEALTANRNSELLIQQSIEFKPNCVVIVDESKFKEVQEALDPHQIKVYAGKEALAQVVEMDSIDLVLTALVGYSGLKPTINAIQNKKQIALANKETLVVAGSLITKLCKQYGVNILPVDSEHSAIFQCLVGEYQNPIEKIYLTASGGPFRGWSAAKLANVTKEQALKHPNWEMGAKITIDSASLMNKGLEVIVHPQSIVHSIVQFEDGSMKAQMGLPDMKLPIQYALAYPHRIGNHFERFNFMDYPSLTFEKADSNTFRNLSLAYRTMEMGGNAACVLNAANEIVVDAFLKDKVGFLQMSDVVENCLEKATFVPNPNYDDFVSSDQEARQLAQQLIK